MATHKSALKAHKQAEKRRVQNRVHRSRLRTQVKKLRKAIDSGDADGARGLLRDTLSLLDRSVGRRILQRNTAARTKSRLTRRINRLGARGRA